MHGLRYQILKATNGSKDERHHLLLNRTSEERGLRRSLVYMYHFLEKDLNSFLDADYIPKAITGVNLYKRGYSSLCSSSLDEVH